MQKECYWILRGVAVQNDIVGEGRRYIVRHTFHQTLRAFPISIPRACSFAMHDNSARTPD